jgi:hypothetical protein
MTAKLKIDLTQGILEVEGSETFVKAIYSDFKLHFVGEEAGESLDNKSKRRRRKRTPPASVPAPEPVAVTPPAEPAEPVVVAEPEPEPPVPVPVQEPPRPEYTFLENLELTAAKDRVSLVEFMDAKFPITNEERNLIFVYYLQHLLKLKTITSDHVYTCYRAAKIRVPLKLENSLASTANHRNWIKITKTGRISVTATGKSYAEKQLPKKLKS